MRTSRIIVDGIGYYHVISRLVAGTPMLSPDEKEHFVRLMRGYERFCGVRVLTYAVMGTHFHILLEVPEREDVSEKELMRRMESIYTREQIAEKVNQWNLWRKQGHEELVQQQMDGMRERMYDLSLYLKTLKQRYTQWYNRQHERSGTLWMERFKSLVVEGRDKALMRLAAYIDLNAVRARIVEEPGAYRWCGYAEALSGNAAAQEGYRTLYYRAREAGSLAWKDISEQYRMHLFSEGEEIPVEEGGGTSRSGISRKQVEKVIQEKGKLTGRQLLNCRIRYYSDGVIIGSRSFVNEIFMKNRGRFGKKRKEGARPLRYAEWGGLCVARDLRRAPIGVS